MTTAKVSGSVDSWCTRCRLMLSHTIESMVGGKITRVHCNTCSGQHAYRAKPPARAASGPKSGGRTSKRAEASAGARANDYEKLIRNRTAATARPYSTSGRFQVGDVIAHATFGLGAITGEKDGTKIEVLFADGPRVLVHGR